MVTDDEMFRYCARTVVTNYGNLAEGGKGRSAESLSTSYNIYDEENCAKSAQSETEPSW
jgi:hypothetical protein